MTQLLILVALVAVVIVQLVQAQITIPPLPVTLPPLVALLTCPDGFFGLLLVCVPCAS